MSYWPCSGPGSLLRKLWTTSPGTPSGRFVTQARIRWIGHPHGIQLGYRCPGQVGDWQREEEMVSVLGVINTQGN